MPTGILHRDTTPLYSILETIVLKGLLLPRTLMNAALVIALILTGLFPGSPMIFESAAQHPDFNALRGSWIRTDGGYRLSVLEIAPDGKAQVQYLNPHPINVSRANVSLQEGLVKLFVELQDKGYPGSTYTLYYFAQKDALAGFYYQATQGKTYEVIFVRQK